MDNEVLKVCVCMWVWVYVCVFACVCCVWVYVCVFVCVDKSLVPYTLIHHLIEQECVQCLLVVLSHCEKNDEVLKIVHVYAFVFSFLCVHVCTCVCVCMKCGIPVTIELYCFHVCLV